MFYDKAAESVPALCWDLIVGATPCVRRGRHSEFAEDWEGTARCFCWEDTWASPWEEVSAIFYHFDALYGAGRV